MADLKAVLRRARTSIDRAEAGLCVSCATTLQRRAATEERPFVYRIAGDEFALLGLEVMTCPKCGEETASIPRIDQLHARIAEILVQSPRPLTGKEIRFLRSRAELSAKSFALLLGVSPEHLSRVENERTATLGLATDRLARAICLAAYDGMLPNLRGVLLDPHCGRRSGASPASTDAPACRFSGEDWTVAGVGGSDRRVPGIEASPS